MKTTITPYWTVLFLSIVAFGLMPAGHVMASDDQTSIEDVKKETSELMETLQAYTSDQREQALKASRTAMDGLDDRIDNLEAQVDDSWDQMNQAARDNARASLKALRDQRTEVAEWYGSMKTSSIGAWDEMKSGFSDAFSALANAWQKAEAEFGPEDDQKTS